jgi:hypothetical protein
MPVIPLFCQNLIQQLNQFNAALKHRFLPFVLPNQSPLPSMALPEEDLDTEERDDVNVPTYWENKRQWVPGTIFQIQKAIQLYTKKLPA